MIDGFVALLVAATVVWVSAFSRWAVRVHDNRGSAR